MKARIKFSKTGSMRFIGHLDVMRYFQKAFRRADIALSYSQGFSPHQLMSFASPLGIGLSSDAEYLDIVLEDGESVSESGAQNGPDAGVSAFGGFVPRLNAVMNDEIRVKGFTLLREDSKTSMAVLAACDYLVTVKPDKCSFLTDAPRRREAVKRLLAQGSIEISKKTKRSEKIVDIRENIYQITDERREFEDFTGISYGDMSLDLAEYVPVLYMQLTAGSVVNIKPELVLEALSRQEGEEYDWLSYQIHRIEMYADIDAKKGEVHTMSSAVPRRLVPLSEYGKDDCVDR